MAQYEQQSYTKQDIKTFLLNDFKDEKNKQKLDYIIEQILEENSYAQISQRAYLQIHHKKLVEIIKNKLKKTITYKHSKEHYTNAL
tara:strand:+ start:2563 stop:2820 length:258 start_codon:yes stop_codon:yes gene_type:complete